MVWMKSGGPEWRIVGELVHQLIGSDPPVLWWLATIRTSAGVVCTANISVSKVSKRKWLYKTSEETNGLIAEVLDDYHTVTVAKLDVDDRGVLIFPILVGFGGNLTSIFVVE